MEFKRDQTHEVGDQALESLPEDEASQNPWPHLSNYFSYVSSDNDKYIFSCRLCLPKRVVAKAHRRTVSNLKQHVTRVHPEHLRNFENCLKLRSFKLVNNSATLSPISTPILSSASVKEEAVTPPQQENSFYPWPHLNDFFLFVSRDGDRFVFNCKVCLPKHVLINGHRSSLNNLKQHISRAHPTFFAAFLEKVKEGSCRGRGKKRLSLSLKEEEREKTIRYNFPHDNSKMKPKDRKLQDSITQTEMNYDVSLDSTTPTTPMPDKRSIDSLAPYDPSDNPWPRLGEYFSLNSREGDKFIFNCKICTSKNSLVKAHRSSLSNLKQHIRRCHASIFSHFLNSIKKGLKQKKKKTYSDSDSEAGTLESPPSPPCPTLHHPSTKPCGSDVSQALVEQRIVDFFVSNLLPHSAVESETFERLIRTLNPTKHSISRRTLGRRISNRQHDSLKEHLINVILPTVRWVSVAVDCFYAHKKGYLGMAVHWLDPTTREMQSAVLACIHFSRQQTPSELHQSIAGVLKEFAIEEKVTRTTVGENFIKSNFASETNSGIQADTHASSQGMMSNCVDASVTALLSGCVDDQQLQYISLASTSNALNELNLQAQLPAQNNYPHNNNNCNNNNHLLMTFPPSEQLICINPPSIQTTTTTNNNANHLNYTNHNINTNNHILSTTNSTTNINTNNTTTNLTHKHITCAAHILNTVASEDAENCLQFNGVYQTAIAKARSLWSLQESSLVAADSVLAEVGERLLSPECNRWTSAHESVVALNGVLESGKRASLQQVMLQMKLPVFDDQDVYFLKEYAMVMTPVAKALEKLQRDEHAHLGTLLPTVAATIFRLNDLKSQDLVYCASLVDALLVGIYKRFEGLLDDQECQLAAAFHPRFRLIWLERFNSTKVPQVRRLMEQEVNEAMREQPLSIGGCQADDDFFSVVTHPHENTNTAHNLVKTWLETASSDLLTDAAFLGEGSLLHCFCRYNTAVPTCSSVDRLFSKGTDILQKKSSLSDEKFDMLLFMKGNMHLMEKLESAGSKTAAAAVAAAAATGRKGSL